MARFVIEEVPSGRGIPISPETFMDLCIGQSIVSFADWGSPLVEFGLSARMNLRVMHTPDGLELALVSTVNPGETPPILFQIPGEGSRRLDRLTDQLVALGELYAYEVMIESPTGSERILDALQEKRSFSSMLTDEEQLYIRALTPGSLWVTAWTTVKSNYQKLAAVVHLVFPQLRDKYLRKMEAETRLRELDVERKAFELDRDKLTAALDLSDRLKKNPAVEEDLRSRLTESTLNLAQDDTNADAIRESINSLMPRRDAP